MIEVLRTNDPVKLSYAVALLKEAGLHPQVMDRFMSVMEGSVAAIQKRVLVPEEEGDRAKLTLETIDDPGPAPEPTPEDWGPEEEGP